MLDSNICIYRMRDNPNLVMQAPLEDCCISTVVYAELEVGYLNSDRRASNRDRLDALIAKLMVVPVDTNVSVAWAELTLSLKNNVIGPNDFWIAAHALSLGLPLVTNNVREFGRMPNLTVENWLE